MTHQTEYVTISRRVDGRVKWLADMASGRTEWVEIRSAAIPVSRDGPVVQALKQHWSDIIQHHYSFV